MGKKLISALVVTVAMLWALPSMAFAAETDTQQATEAFDAISIVADESNDDSLYAYGVGENLNEAAVGVLSAAPEVIVEDSSATGGEEAVIPTEATEAGKTATNISIEAGVYLLASKLDEEKALTIHGDDLNEGSAAELSKATYAWNQVYNIQPVGDGYYKVIPLHSAKALDFDSAGEALGAKALQSAWQGDDTQLWAFRKMADGGYGLVNKASGYALSVQESKTDNGTPIILREAADEPAQSWKLVRIVNLLGDGVYALINNHGTGRVVQMASAAGDNGIATNLWHWTAVQNQRFRIKHVGEGNYTIEALSSGKLLTVSDKSVTQQPATGDASQLWKVQPNGARSVSFINQSNGLALDVAGGNDWDGCEVRAWESNFTPAQAFRVKWVGEQPASWLNMHEKVANLSSPTEYLLAVDSTNCIVGVYQGKAGAWNNIAMWTCAPGAYGTPTVKGLFSVADRGYVFGGSYSCYYWTQFYGNYLFHSVLYNPGTRTIQDGTLGVPASHGCVRLAIENAEWINKNIPRGTTVYSY